MGSKTIIKAAKAGDVGDVRLLQLVDVTDGVESIVDLTNAASVRVIVRKHTAVVLSASVSGDPTNGTISVDLGTAPGDWLPAEPRAGNWKWESEVTYNSGDIITYPNDGYDVIPVIDDLD